MPDTPATTPDVADTTPKKRGVWVWIVAALAGVVLVGGGVFGWGAYRDAQAAQREAERIDQIRTTTHEIDATFDDVWDALDLSDRQWSDVPESMQADELPGLIIRTTNSIDKQLERVAEARESATTIPDEEISEAYLEVCDELDRVLTANSESLMDFKEVADQADGAYDVEADITLGHEKLDEAIRTGNAREHTKSEAAAAEAEELFTESVAAYVAINKVVDDAKLTEYIAWLNECVEQAQMQVTLAQYGRTKGVSTFNRQVDAVNEHREELWKMPGSYYVPEFGFTDAKRAGGDLVFACRSAETRLEHAQELTLEETTGSRGTEEGSASTAD